MRTPVVDVIVAALAGTTSATRLEEGVDGSRDTPAVVDAFVEHFDESFIGLTGPEEDVRAFASDYFLYFAHADGGGSSAGYLVDHTSYSYLIGPDGRLRAIYPFDTAISTITSDLEALPAT